MDKAILSVITNQQMLDRPKLTKQALKELAAEQIMNHRSWTEKAFKIINLIHNEDSIDSAYLAVTKNIGKVFNAERSFIMSFNDTTPEIKYEYLKNENTRTAAHYIVAVESPFYKELKMGIPALISSVSNGGYTQDFKDYAKKAGFNSAIVYPIKDGENILGYFEIHLKESHRWQEYECYFIESILNSLAGLIYREKAKEEKEKAKKLRENTFKFLTKYKSFRDVCIDNEDLESTPSILLVEAFIDMTGAQLKEGVDIGDVVQEMSLVLSEYI